MLNLLVLLYTLQLKAFCRSSSPSHDRGRREGRPYQQPVSLDQAILDTLTIFQVHLRKPFYSTSGLTDFGILDYEGVANSSV